MTRWLIKYYKLYLYLQVLSFLTRQEATTAAPDMKNISLGESSHHESGVDMAFDALMELEKNSDLSDFMKNYTGGSDSMENLWTVDNNTLITNSQTESVLR